MNTDLLLSFKAELPAAYSFICLAVGSLVVLLVSTFINNEKLCYKVSSFLSFVTLSLTGVFHIMCQMRYWFKDERAVFNGMVLTDPFSYMIILLIILGATLNIPLISKNFKSKNIDSPGEFYSLYLMCTFGACLFASAGEMITLFLGIETMSLSLYCLCGASLYNRRCSESSLKYFILGSFSSAFLLYGMSLVYGLTGTLDIRLASEILTKADPALLGLTIGMFIVGLFFKLGAVPFHFWVPDVYQGAPTSVTAFMSSVIKISAMAVCLRVFALGFGHSYNAWSGVVWFIAVLSMIVGNLIAIRQNDVKRMLAYSSIAHVGYMLVGLLTYSDQYEGGAAVIFYLITYAVVSIGAFGCLLIFSNGEESAVDAYDLNKFKGIGQRRPLLGLLFSLLLLALAGLPPGVSGLTGKLFLFYSGIKAQYLGLVIIGLLSSVVSIYYYLKVIVYMYFYKNDSADEIISTDIFALQSTVVFCCFLVLLFGILPSPLYEFTQIVMSGFGR